MLSKIVSIAAGDSHSMALKADGTVWGWGSEQYGQLGNGVIGTASYVPYSQTPTQVQGSAGVGFLTRARLRMHSRSTAACTCRSNRSRYRLPGKCDTGRWQSHRNLGSRDE